jgi:hypothetical protein
MKILTKFLDWLRKLKCELTSCCGCTMKCNQDVETESEKENKD